MITSKRFLKDFSSFKIPFDFEHGVENTLLLDAFYGILKTFINKKTIDAEKKRLLELIIKNKNFEVLSKKTIENKLYYDKLIECCRIILELN